MDNAQGDRIVAQLGLKYARFVDDKAFDRMQEIMAEDVVMAAPAFECKSLEAFMTQLEFLHQFSGTLHIIGNQLGEWNGDTYQGETYCVASHIYEKNGKGRKLEMGIRYDDTIAPIDGCFKYTRRYLNIVWESDLALSDNSEDSIG